MSIEFEKQRIIESLNMEKEQKLKEIKLIEQRISKVKENPECCITLKSILDGIDNDPYFADKPKEKRRRVSLLNVLSKKIGTGKSYSTVYELSGATPTELMKKTNFGQMHLNETISFLAEFNLTLAEDNN